MRPRFWPLAYALLLAACGGCESIPVVPVPPAPVPPEPPQPTPVPPDPIPTSKVVPYAVVHAITPGQTRADVNAMIGFTATFDTPQDDGTRIAEWPAVNAAGEAKYLDVQFDAAGKVIGHALIPRATR